MKSRRGGFLIRNTTGALATALAIFAGPVLANECGSQSELMQQLGEGYYHIDSAREPASSMKASVRGSHSGEATGSKRAARSLSRVLEKVQQQEFRRGSGVRYTCKGTGQRTRLESAQFDLVDIERVNTLNGGSQFNAYEDYNQERIVRSATISLPSQGEWVMSGKGGIEHSMRYRNCFFGNRNARLQHILPQRKQCVPEPVLQTTINGSIYQQPINPVGSYLGEIRLEASMRGKDLVIRETRYINGHKTEWVEWRLRS